MYSQLEFPARGKPRKIAQPFSPPMGSPGKNKHNMKNIAQSRGSPRKNVAERRNSSTPSGDPHKDHDDAENPPCSDYFFGSPRKNFIQKKPVQALTDDLLSIDTIIKTSQQQVSDEDDYFARKSSKFTPSSPESDVGLPEPDSHPERQQLAVGSHDGSTMDAFRHFDASPPPPYCCEDEATRRKKRRRRKRRRKHMEGAGHDNK
jgi:hypothetical protein